MIDYTLTISKEKISSLVSNYRLSEYIRGKLEQDSGVYVLYGNNRSALYVGWSGNLAERIRSHFGLYSNTKSFMDEVKSVSILCSSEFKKFREESVDFDDIEIHLIHKLNPKYNVMSKAKNHAEDIAA